MEMAVDQSLNLKSGSVIQGKYEVVSCLGAGSMGMVYSVKHLELQGRLLAMKVLYSDVAKDEIQAARFRNEIVASYEINHPNVVRAYDFFREGDLVAYTMEFVTGGDLADKLNEDELIPIPEAIHMLVEMASGVEAIHKAGIVHRDLKPENILLSPEGTAKITDFGIARNLKGPRLTEHGGIVGTFAYVAPEYLENGVVDERSDIYSLGVLAYEMIAGEPPYNGANVIEEMHLRLTTDPTPPIDVRSECPQALSDIIMMALARDPEERFATARKLRKALFAIDYYSHRTSTIEFSPKKNEQTPKVLDSDVSKLLSGLRNSLSGGDASDDSLHDSPYNSLHNSRNDSLEDETDYNSQRPVYSATHAQVPVSVSEGRLSIQKIREFGVNRNDEKVSSSVPAVFITIVDIIGSFLIVIMGLLLGLVIIRWAFPEISESLYGNLIRMLGLL